MQVVAGVVPFDTTGLPPGATFGATTGTGPALTTGLTDAATGTIGDTPRPERPAHQASLGGLQVGQSFSPRYLIIKLLGAGGMGAVYQTWDAELGIAVALKVIRTDRQQGTVTAETEKQFKHELLLARKVTHKNVVRIHDLGEVDGVKYLTMPFVQGEDIATALRRDGKRPVPYALRIARQIAAGLEAAHDAGVVHRDLKPANIMIGVTEDDAQAQIMDFGISVSASEVTSGRVTGTLEYMAPEQGVGGAVDARADLYAFGLILYELLTGLRPMSAMTGQERIEAMKQRCRDGVPQLRTADPAIPEPLDAVVMRCLERDPSARFQSAHELCVALDALNDAGELIPTARSLTPRMMAVTALVAVIALSGTALLVRQAMQVPEPHAPVSVAIADFDNRTGDPAFDGTLEPMLKRALEGAGFISAYDRNAMIRTLGVRPPETLNELAAGELAAKQGLGVVLSGAIDRQGTGFRVSIKAAQTVTGNVVASEQGGAATSSQVLETATRLVTRVRQALGDDASESDQMFAMASLSTTSLDLVRHYAAAQDAASNGRFEESRQRLLQAVALDPKFGIGYQLLAVTSRNLGRVQDAEKYSNQALQFLSGMTDREKLSTRGLYFRMSGDYQQCVKEYGELIARYAADVIGHNQLALCLSKLRQMRRAVEEMQAVVTLLPKRVLFRDNLALYANYAGDFQVAEREARTVQEPDAYATLALAFAQLGQRQLPQARATYEKLGAINALGASLAASGLGDLATVEGRFSDAVGILRAGAAADLASKDADRAAAKFAALAHAEASRGRTRAAIEAAEQALAHSQTVTIRFLAARSLVEAGDIARAQPLIASLARESQPEPQAYAKILEGQVALDRGDPRLAITLLTEANTLLDTWIGHFDLGRAYLDDRQFVQADSEFERCIRRGGEALSLMLDEEPTYGYFPMVYYYQGRVRQALKNEGFSDAYRLYLTFRGQSKEDRLVPEARQYAGG
jgi:tetratricopeptide (TPR) repeat protein